MAKLKLTKTLIDGTRAEARDIELRDTIVPGFLCKVTPSGSKVFMVQYRTNDGLRRKPSIGRFGELSVEQARGIASDMLAEAEGLEHASLLLAIRLQFTFAARMSEITQLEWAWVDFRNSRVTWPDSKTGGISKPISSEVMQLLKAAKERGGSAYVCHQPGDVSAPIGKGVYYVGWRRVLRAAGVPLVGTHGIRHRAATDIANSGVSVKVGMALTAHKTVTMFMRYVHVEDDPIRQAAELVAQRRRDMTMLSGEQT